jgi:RNA polymerase sigma-70 factor (ECF subfamily)
VTSPVWPAELREWIREHTPRLLAVARGFASGETEAEDILQEVWWRAARRACDRAPGVPLGAWLVAVTLNVGRDHRRRSERRRRLFLLWGGEGQVAPPPADPIHEGSRLWSVVGSLPRLQREVVILRVIEELSTEATATMLGRAEGTVKASLSRAMEKLRKELGEGRADVERR